MSEIWKYFKQGKSSISCNHCSQTFAFAKDKSTSKLWSHLQSKHAEQFTLTTRNRKRKLIEFAAEQKEPTPSTSNKQAPIDEMLSPNFAKTKRSELTNDVTEFVTMHNLPFTISESPFLKRLVMKNYATNWMPSRHEVRAEIPKKAEQCVKNLQTSVLGQFVSLTLDEYSKGENALFCMTGTWLDETFEFHSRVLSVTSFLSRHTGENICREIDSTIDKLCIEKVVAATRDGARNMAAGCRIARIPSIWCFCHLIHVAIVTSFNKTSEITVLLKKSSDIINFFANSPTGTAAFRRVQGQCSTTFIKATKTRWNSVMQSLSSLLKHQLNLSKYVEQFPTCASVKLINKLSPSDFERISKIISVLEPFDICTKMASAESATVSCYQYFINVLTKHLSRFECDLANQMTLELEKRTTEVLQIEEIEFSTFLDPRFCNKIFVYPEERWRLIKAKFTHHLIMSSEQKAMEFVSPSYVMGTSSKAPENELWPEDDVGPSETEFEPSQSPLERAIGEQLQKYCNFVKSDKLGFPKPDEEPNWRILIPNAFVLLN